MTHGVVRIAAAVIVLAGVTACSGQSTTPQTPQSVYLSSFNQTANELGAPSAKPGSSFEKQVLGYGHDFCAVFQKDFKTASIADPAKDAQKAIEAKDGIPADLAGAVFTAATESGSLCPAK